MPGTVVFPSAILHLVCAVFAAVGAASAAEPEAPSGDAVIRAPAGKSEIIITTTARLAGAIHSLVWDGKEFIDSADHGRQLQSACSFDNTPAAGAETFNPTEAGSRDDGAGPRSTSRLLELAASGRELRTRTQMAFWLAPGERSGGQLARNATALSDVVLSKQVHIGFDRWPQMLDYRVVFTLPPGAMHKAAQFEALTGYMPPEFERFWQWNSATGKLEALSDGPGEISQPVVLATASGSHAMGIFSTQPGVTYGRWRFTAERVVKWNCVFRERNPDGLPARSFAYRMFVPIGTLTQVEATLADLWKERDRAAATRDPGLCAPLQ